MVEAVAGVCLGPRAPVARLAELQFVHLGAVVHWWRWDQPLLVQVLVQAQAVRREAR